MCGGINRTAPSNLLESTNADLRAVAEMMVGRQSGVQLIQEQDQASYVAFAPITTAGWSVALIVPANEIDAPAIATGQRLSESQSRLWNQLVAVLLMIIVTISILASCFRSRSLTGSACYARVCKRSPAAICLNACPLPAATRLGSWSMPLTA